jgi:hypothetical protein
MVLPVDEYWRRTALHNPPDFTENDIDVDERIAIDCDDVCEITWRHRHEYGLEKVAG